MQKKSLTPTVKNGARKTAAKSRIPKAASSQVVPSREEIAKRAYEIFAARGTGGRELEDWTQAERELSEKMHRNN